MSETFKFDAENFYRAATAYPGILANRMRPALQKSWQNFVREMKTKHLSGPAPGALVPRTGALRRSPRGFVFGAKLMDMGFTTFMDTATAPHSTFHEPPPGVSEVRPKTAKALAIPLSSAKNPSGVVKAEYTPPQGGSLRDIPGLFLMKFKSGKAMLVKVQKSGRGKNAKVKILFLFILKGGVRVVRRLGFMDLFNQLNKVDGPTAQYLHDAIERSRSDWNRLGSR